MPEDSTFYWYDFRGALPGLYAIPGNHPEQEAQKARQMCLMNPESCPAMSSNYANLLSIGSQVYLDWLLGEPDPTGGSIYFSHATSLTRGEKKFRTYEDLRNYLAANFQKYADRHSDFNFYISRVFEQPDGSFAILVIGNQPCVWDSSCH